MLTGIKLNYAVLKDTGLLIQLTMLEILRSTNPAIIKKAYDNVG
jgi:hypothetical protein